MAFQGGVWVPPEILAAQASNRHETVTIHLLGGLKTGFPTSTIPSTTSYSFITETDTAILSNWQGEQPSTATVTPTTTQLASTSPFSPTQPVSPSLSSTPYTEAKASDSSIRTISLATGIIALLLLFILASLTVRRYVVKHRSRTAQPRQPRDAGPAPVPRDPWGNNEGGARVFEMREMYFRHALLEQQQRQQRQQRRGRGGDGQQRPVTPDLPTPPPVYAPRQAWEPPPAYVERWEEEAAELARGLRVERRSDA